MPTNLAFTIKLLTFLAIPTVNLFSLRHLDVFGGKVVTLFWGGQHDESSKKSRFCSIFLRILISLNFLILSRDVETVIFQPLPLPHLSLPLSLTKNEKTTVDNFFNFCGSVACLLLHFIILRKQKPSFIVITLPTSLELIVPNYAVFLLFRY